MLQPPERGELNSDGIEGLSVAWISLAPQEASSEDPNLEPQPVDLPHTTHLGGGGGGGEGGFHLAKRFSHL